MARSFSLKYAESISERVGKKNCNLRLVYTVEPPFGPLSRLQREFKDFSPSVFAFIRGEITKHADIPILK